MESQRIESNTYRTYNQLVEDFITGQPITKKLKARVYSEALALQYASQREFTAESRSILVEALKSQYAKAGIDSANGILSAQLGMLSKSASYTITTGHQLCLITGPLYFPIKILQIIKMCENLNSAQEGKTFIPVFWMASEDHDFDEVNHAHIFGKTLEWNDEQGGIVGDYNCESLETTLLEIKTILGNSERADELMALFNESYSSDANLSIATRRLVHALFGHKGLIILDANDPELKKALSPYLLREVAEQLSNTLVAQTNELLTTDYKIQVNPRPINLFYISSNSRMRIDLDNKEFRTENGGKTWQLDEIKAEIVEYPERFSPNVILRPLYQEIILPNIAYVGGPGEISYWLQLAASFEGFGVQFPLLSLRNSFVWLDAAKMKKLNKLDLLPEDLFLSEPDVTMKLVNLEEDANEIEAETISIMQSFENIAQSFQKVDASLKAYTLAEGRKTEKQLEEIKKRLIRAKKDKNREQLDSYWNMHEKVFPKGNLHERYDNFVPYYLKHGAVFFDTLSDAIDPVDTRLCVISE
ncbi:MAG: bacillithiol biosynthesis cysteine-adding enzyme BshC [Vicingaceae bacterium]